MRRSIFKYRLEDKQPLANSVRMNRGSKILHVGADLGYIPAIWCEVDEKLTFETRIFHVVPTGSQVLPLEHMINWEYVGTVNTNNSFVWHIYEEIEV